MYCHTSKRIAVVSLLSCGLALGACSDDPNPPPSDAPNDSPTDAPTDAPNNSLSINGAITGDNIPQAGKLVVLWAVDNNNGDQTYKWGDGTASNTTFAVSFDSAPPSGVVNPGGGAVGFVVLVDSLDDIAEGIVDPDALNIVGVSAQHSIIWKEEGSTIEGWFQNFETGYSCGVCVPATEGQTFDSYAPAGCGDVVVETTTDIETLDFCNWS